MKEKHQCPECNTKSLSKMQLLERWWCTTCDQEIDVDKTIQQWASHGYQGKVNDDRLYEI